MFQARITQRQPADDATSTRWLDADDGVTDNIQSIREALGAIPLGAPMVCWVYPGTDGEWWVRHDGDAAARSFDGRARALTAAQVAVARAASYCLYVQDEDGRIMRYQSN
jgi:hypothetical protein